MIYEAGGEDGEAWAFSPPNRPTNLEYEAFYLEPGELTYINFTWDVPEKWGSSEGIGYNLYRWSNGTVVRIYELRGIYNSTPYKLITYYEPYPYGDSFNIKAVNLEGESLPSNNVTIIDDYDPVIEVHYQNPVWNTVMTYNLKADIVDGSGIASAWIEYWFENDDHQNVSMVQLYSSTWEAALNIDKRLGMFYYIIRANDTWNNWAVSDLGYKEFIDEIPPHFREDRTPRSIDAGEILIFDVEIWDNRYMDFVAVEIGYDEYNFGNETFNLTQVDEVNWTFSYLTRRRPGSIWYRIFGADSVGYTFDRPWIKIQLTGNDAPIIINNRTQESIPMGEDLIFSVEIVDRRDVERVWVEYRFDWDQRFEEDLHSSGDNNWSLRTSWPGLKGPIVYQIHIETTWGRTISHHESRIELTDFVNPVITKISKFDNLTTGDYFDFWCWATDDVGIASVGVHYTWGEGTTSGFGLNTEDGIYYHQRVAIPSDAVEFSYWFTARDIYGNRINSSAVNLTVLDNDPPTIWSIGNLEGGTGGKIIEDFYVRDNVGVRQVLLEYIDPIGGNPTEKRIYKDGTDGFYSYFTLEMDLWTYWTGELDYNMTVEDLDGNIGFLGGYTIEVEDVIPPAFYHIEDHIFTEGEKFEIILDVTDNIMIRRLEWEGIPLESETNEISGSIDERGVYRVNVTAIDTSGNEEHAEFIIYVESASGIQQMRDGGFFLFFSIALIIIVIILIVLLTVSAYKIEMLREKVEEYENMSEKDEDVRGFLSSLERRIMEEE
ncbi:MAG: fibronectin type III domain-containing protein [Thermoplasmatota archaeon]